MIKPNKVGLTLEAELVDGPYKLKETNTVVRILCKVLVDHVQGHVKHRFQDNGDLLVQ
jgi:hypothetical protein